MDGCKVSTFFQPPDFRESSSLLIWFLNKKGWFFSPPKMMRISGRFGETIFGREISEAPVLQPAGGPSYAILVCQRRLAKPIFSIPKLKGWERRNLIDLPVAGLLKGCNILKVQFFRVLQAATGIIAPMTSLPHPGEKLSITVC